MKLTRLVLLAALVGMMVAPRGAGAEPEWNDPNSLPIWLTEEEKQRLDEIGLRHRSTAAPTGEVRNPAEWEPTEGVIVRWPLGISVALIAEMSEDLVVTTIVGNSSQQQSATNAYTSGGVNMAHTEFIIAATDSYWTRDYGPWFIFEDDSLAIVDHIYNRPRPHDDVIPQVIGAEWGLDVYGLSLNHTGGNHMSDGLGMSASTELVYNENPGQSETQIHGLMRDYLGNEYTVLDYIESGGIHHIDCWAKYLNPTTVLVKEVDPGHPSHDLLDARADYLAQQISPWGEPYTVVRVYCPSGTAYTNSLILNDKVLVPIFGSAWDSVALQVYADAMPGYEILGFSGSWLDDDAIHCRAMGVPDRGMLFIDHVPFKTDDVTTGDYRIAAEIVANSGASLRLDQLKVFYSVDGGGWSHVLMSETEEPDVYAADVPAQDEGSVVRYYISAADESGRQEQHPYIGRLDPHEFGTTCPNHPAVDVTPDGPLTLCAGSDQTLRARLSGGGGPFTYEWTADGVALPGAVGPNLVINASGTHTYNCRVWGDGCATARTDPEDVVLTWQAEPAFEGIAAVSSPQEATCTLDLDWTPAVPACDGPVYYDVHRSTVPGFTPDATSLLVAGVGGTGHRDAHELVEETTYYYVVRARDDSNDAEDDNLVERHGTPVGPPTPGDWLDDAEEATRFAPTGLWHVVDDTPCVNPGYQSPTHGFYFGNDAQCDFDTGAESFGMLTSQTIYGVGASSSLSFFSYLHTEQYAGFDEAIVEISSDDGQIWFPLDRDLTNGGTIPDDGGAWSYQSYGLAAYQGQDVVIRFRFDSVDDESNDTMGWLLDDILVRDVAVDGSCVSEPGCTMTVNVLPNGRTSVCDGEGVLFEAIPDGGTPPYTYQWTEDGFPLPGATQSTLEVTYGWAQAHDYNCIVADSGSCTEIVDGYDVEGEWTACGGVVTVADGTEAGTTPLRVRPSGENLAVFWDAATPGCTSDDYHLIWGWGRDVASHAVAGSDCTLVPSGAHLWGTSPDAAADWVWFLVVGRDDSGAEGGWGMDSFGAPRSTDPSGECGTISLENGACLP